MTLDDSWEAIASGFSVEEKKKCAACFQHAKDTIGKNEWNNADGLIRPQGVLRHLASKNEGETCPEFIVQRGKIR